MHPFRTAVALALLSVALSAKAAAQQSSDVAVGVFPFLEGDMDSRIGEIVSNCSSRGIDTVYVSAFRATGSAQGDLWVTDRAGDWNPAWGPVRSGGAGIDLVNLISACHAANLRVVAVLKCFDASVQPTDVGHKQFLLDVVDYFVDAYTPAGTPVYDLDGLALDYVRFVGSSTGNDPSQVTNFVHDVKAHLRGLSLHAYLIASRYNFDGGSYNGNFLSYTAVMASLASQYGQNWQHMAAYVDVLMPMAYTADGSIYNSYALHQAYVQATASYARTACTLAGYPNRRVCPTLRTYADSSETTTDQTIDASITGALLGGGDGYQSFRYGHLMSHPSWWTKMAQYAMPGANWPVPVMTVNAALPTALFDPSLSRDSDEPNGSLQVRFDFDGDGSFDTTWMQNAPAAWLERYPTTWTTTLQVRDAQGHVGATHRRFAGAGALLLSPPALSAGLGGSVQIQLDTGPNGAFASYLLLAGVSGSSPGFAWRTGLPVPLNIDFLTVALANTPNSPFLQNGLGVCDAQGRATATLTLPPGLLTVLAGMPVTWTALVADPLGQPVFAAEADSLWILP